MGNDLVHEAGAQRKVGIVEIAEQQQLPGDRVAHDPNQTIDGPGGVDNPQLDRGDAHHEIGRRDT